MCTAACLVIFFLFVSLPPGKQMCGACLPSQHRKETSQSFPPSFNCCYLPHQNKTPQTAPQMAFTTLCLLFPSPTESGLSKSSCDTGSNDHFSVFISFFSHHHLISFSSTLKSPFSCFYTPRCPLVAL